MLDFRSFRRSAVSAVALASALALIPMAAQAKCNPGDICRDGAGMFGENLSKALSELQESDYGEPAPYVLKTVETIAEQAGLQSNFALRAVRGKRFANAVAITEGANRFIVYGEEFMRPLDQPGSSRYWDAFVILAHEVGHHLNGHTLDNQGSSPQPEAEADYFAGSAVKRAGGSVADARRIYRRAPLEESPTHPRRGERLHFVSTGWESAKSFDEHYRVFKQVETPPGSGKYESTLSKWTGKDRKWSESQTDGKVLTDQWREIAREDNAIYLYDEGRTLWMKLEVKGTLGFAEASWATGKVAAKLYDNQFKQWTPLNPKETK